MNEKTKQNGLYKRVLSVVLTMAVLLMMTPVWGLTANSVESSNGIMPLAAADDATPITTAEEFKAQVKNSGNFRLENDITVTEPVPAGFSGTFDGNGHTITVDISSSSSNVGLFPLITSTAVIKNLGVTGSVESTGSSFPTYAGGIVGYNNGGMVQNCYNSATVSSSAFIAYTGGIVGGNDNSGTVENCYNTGSITSDSNTGGIAGGNAPEGSTGTIKNCYNIGTVSSYANSCGIVGVNVNSGEVTSCFTINTMPDGNGGGTSIAEAAFANSSTFSGWDFDDTWVMSSLITPFARPILKSCAEGLYDTGSLNEYAVSNRNGMEMLKDYVNGTNDYSIAHTGAGLTFKLTADIDLSGKTWTPIGSWSSSTIYKAFSGTFDGGGHEINLNISSSSSHQGVFGYVSGGTVKNLGVTGTVNCTGNYVGGITARNNGTIINCYNQANVAGSAAVGGIAGVTENDSAIKNCYNTGTVSGSNSAGNRGGIVGLNGTNAAGPINCYTPGTGMGAPTTTQFANGEVAWLLQNGQENKNTLVWGQGLGTPKDDNPVLTSDPSKKVYKVEFMVGTTTTGKAYANYNGTVIFSEPSSTYIPKGQNFDHWEYNGKEFTSSTQVTDDITVNAVLTADTPEAPDLSDVKVTVKKSKNTITVTLDPADPNAEFYYVDENGEEVVSKTGEFTDLEPGKDYEIKVRYEGSDGTDAAEVTTVNEDGSTTVKPGETAITDNGEVTNDGTKVTVKDSSGNTTEITPTNKGDVELKKDGSVSLPDGGTVKTGDTTVTVPPNGSVKTESDGSVSLPEGGTFTAGDADVTVPAGGTVKADSNGNISVSEGTTVTQNGTTVTVVDDATVGTDGSVSLPDGGDVKIGDTTVTVPESGGTIKPDNSGNVAVPDGSVVKGENGDPDITLNDGGTLEKGGNITVSKGGHIEIGDTKITVTEGGTIERTDDGSVTVPDGSVVTPPNGAPDITVENSNGSNATVDDKGNVDFPNGGEAKVGDKDVTIPDEGTLEPVGDGFVKIPEGSTIDGETLESDGVLDSNGDTYDGAVIIDDVLFIPPEGKEVTETGDGVTVPAGTTVVPKDGGSYTVESDNGIVDTKDGGSVTFPDGEGEIKVGNTTVTVPEGSTVTPTEDGVTVPDGSIVKGENGNPDITLTDGGTVESDGDITVPEGGQIEIGDTTVTVPGGGTFERNDDGSVTVPDGSKVKNGDTEIEIKDGNGSATVDKDGNVSFPKGGEAEIDGAEITVPKDGTIEPQEDGTVLLPEGSTVTTPDGEETTVGSGGGSYDPSTGEVENGGGNNNNPGGGNDNPGSGGNDNPGGGGNDNPGSGGNDNPGSGGNDNPGSGNNNPGGGNNNPGGNSGNNSGDTNTSTGDNTNDNVNVGIVSGDNAPNATISAETASKLKEDVIANHLTDEEKAAIENGAELDIVLSVEYAGDSVSSADKQATEAALADTEYTLRMYLNIDLFKLIDGQQTKITKINSPISVTIEIPETLRKEHRTYAVVHVHDGEAEILKDTDSDPNTITITTDKFSTFAIVYKDAEAPSSGNPDTGITMPIAVAVLASTVTVTAVMVKKKKMR